MRIDFLYFVLLLIFSIRTTNVLSSENWSFGDDINRFKSEGGASVVFKECDHPSNQFIHVELPGTITKKWDYKRGETYHRDNYIGLRFKVRGDGSNNIGVLSIWANRSNQYAYFFPLKNTQWRAYVVLWADLFPIGLPVNYDPRPMNAYGGTHPGDICGIDFSIIPEIFENKRSFFDLAELQYIDNTDLANIPVKDFRYDGVSENANQSTAHRSFSILCIGYGEKLFSECIKEKLRARTKYTDIRVTSQVAGKCEIDTPRICLALGVNQYDYLIYSPSFIEKRVFALPCEVYQQHCINLIERFIQLKNNKATLIIGACWPGKANYISFFDDYEHSLSKVCEQYKIAYINGYEQLKSQNTLLHSTEQSRTPGLLTNYEIDLISELIVKRILQLEGNK